MLNQKTMELYKKENYNIVGSCFAMLINLVLTLVIFISLFGAMRNISEFKIASQYTELENVYQTTITETTGTEEEKIEAAQNAVLVKYEEVKESFLWVQNIWIPDTSATVIPDYENFLKLANLSEENTPTKQDYDEVMEILQQEKSGWNGLYILIILAGAITYFSQKILMGKKKSANLNKEAPEAPPVNMNFMLYLLPILMIVFTISYSAAFALYIVTNSVMTMVLAVISNKILDKIEARKELEENKNKPQYSR